MSEPDQDKKVVELVNDIYQWAESTFPARTDTSMFLKMFKELGELIDAPDDPMEVADVLIMVLDYARRKNIDVASAITQKLAINRQRKWKINPDGTMSHVKHPE